MTEISDWMGNSEQSADRIALGSARSLAATLDKPPSSIKSGDPLPPLWHWVYFSNAVLQTDLASDGHPRKGGFMPPVTLPRRMWAGSKFKFHQPLIIGEDAQRTSTIVNISEKSGKSGELVFVSVDHKIMVEGEVFIEERQDIVYRQPVAALSGKTEFPGPADHEFRRKVTPDPVLLFRYSALTFNGHRIHYDRNYAQEVEGYPGLVVHGPLLATLLLDLLTESYPEFIPENFEFRAIRPVFDIDDFYLCGKAESPDSIHLWVTDHMGYLCMEARAMRAS